MRAAVASSLLLLLCAGAAQGAANPYLEEARRLYAAQRFTQAKERLELARQVPTEEPGQKEQVLDLLARCHVAEGRKADAQRVYQELLAQNPHWAPEPSTSPKILEAYTAAKAKAFPEGYVALRVEPNGPASSRVELVDPYGRVRSLVLLRGDRKETLPPKPLTVALSPSSREPPWSVEAKDESQAVLARFSSTPEAPEVVVVQPPPPAPPPPSGPKVQRWLAWAAAGVAASAVAGAGWVQQSSNQSAAAARAEPWSDVARAHQARAQAQADTALVLLGGAALAAGASVVLFTW